MAIEPSKVVYLKKPKRFTLHEARELFPKVRKITNAAVTEAQPVIDELQEGLINDEEREVLSKRLQQRVDSWAEDIAKLGALAKGLWLVDFDSGSGYFCWVHGEEEISFFHGYEEGFSGRTPIQ